jgi:hypothetical protein
MRGAWGKWSEEDYTRLFEEARRADGEGRVAEAG